MTTSLPYPKHMNFLCHTHSYGSILSLLLDSATITIHSIVCTTSTNMHAQHHVQIVCLSVRSNSLDPIFCVATFPSPPSSLLSLPHPRPKVWPQPYSYTCTFVHGQHFITDGTANPMSPCVLVCVFMYNNRITYQSCARMTNVLQAQETYFLDGSLAYSQ